MRRRAPPRVDVYLQPAVVGGGLGDIEEVLAVGRRLARQRFPLFLFRAPGRPLPPSVDGPWDWPRVRRVARAVGTADRAVTVTPWWGVSAAPDPAERPGAPGPWSEETARIEAAYGRDRVLHVSLEEFARTYTSRQQTWERWREGGTRSRRIPERLRGVRGRKEVEAFRRAYRAWRAFDRPNVLHLFPGFAPSRAFAREFPEAVQLGPLWPFPPAPRAPLRRTADGRRRWVWYASPSTSDRLARLLTAAFPRPMPGGGPVEVGVRAPRRFPTEPTPGIRWRWLEPMPADRWRRRFASADLRIATGTRTLLEAIDGGGPFLYFNGAMGEGRAARRHRPEKIASLLSVWADRGVPARLRRDLADFARLRSVASVAWRAATDPAWGRGFPPRRRCVRYVPPWDDAGAALDRWLRRWAASSEDAVGAVGRLRREARGALAVP